MFSEERISAAELQRRGERSATVRQVLYALADRVHYWTVGGMPQDDDIIVLAKAREMGWVPWYEREPGKTQYEESLRKIAERQGGA